MLAVFDKSSRDALKAKWRATTNLDETRLKQLGEAYRDHLIKDRYPLTKRRSRR